MEELKLLNVVKTVILSENRIDDAKKLAQKIGVEETSFNQLLAISERVNPNHKYLRWLTEHLKTFDEKFVNDVIELLQYFDRNPTKFKKRDIAQYNSISELEHTILKVANQKRREVEIVEGTRVLYDDDKFVVLIPETKAASCHYGLGTTWCTANKESDFYRNYRKDGELYYIISRSKPTSDPTYKMAVRLVFDSDGDYPPNAGIAEIRDAQNTQIQEGDLTENSSANVLTAVRQDFNKKWEIWWGKMAAPLKKQREEEAIKTAKERAERAERDRLDAQRNAVRNLERQNEREARREAGEYDDDDVVHALRQYLIEEGDWEAGDEEEVNRISAEITNINDQIEDLEQRVIDFPDDADTYNQQLDELRDRLEILEGELNDATGGDIYELHREGYDHHGELAVFTDNYNGKEWAIGTDDEADAARRADLESFIDEFRNQPGMGFTAGYIDNFIDGDEVANDYEDDVDGMVRESPSDYISDDPEFSEEGQRLIDEKQEQIVELETKRSELEDQKYELEANDEDTSDIDSELEDVETEIADLESEIEDIRDDDDYKEYTEEQIEAAVQRRLDEFRDDPIRELNDWGVEDFSRYVDEEKLIDSVIEDDGRGQLSSYDGEERETTYNGTTYYIYLLNA